MPPALIPLSSHLRRASYRVVLVVLIIGILLSLALSLWVAHQVDEQVEGRFEQLSTRQVERSGAGLPWRCAWSSTTPGPSLTRAHLRS